MQDVLKVVGSCDFLVSQIDDEKYIKQMPFVSYQFSAFLFENH